MNSAIINRPGVAGAVLQTPSLQILFCLAMDLFNPNLVNIIKHKPLKLEIRNFQRRFTSPTCRLSHVIRHMSHVMCHMKFKIKKIETIWWIVCYQRGLPCLVKYLTWFFIGVFLPNAWYTLFVKHLKIMKCCQNIFTNYFILLKSCCPTCYPALPPPLTLYCILCSTCSSSFSRMTQFKRGIARSHWSVIASSSHHQAACQDWWKMQ